MLCHPLPTAVLPRAVTHVRHAVHHHLNTVARVGRAQVHAHHVPGHAVPVWHAPAAPPPDMIVCTRVPGAPPLGAGAGHGAPVAGGQVGSGVPFQPGAAAGGSSGGGLGGGGASGYAASGAGAGVGGVGSAGLAASVATAAKAGLVAGGLALAALGLGSAVGGVGGTTGAAGSSATQADTGPSLFVMDQPVPQPAGPQGMQDEMASPGAPGVLPVSTMLPGVPGNEVQVPTTQTMETAPAAVPEPGSVTVFGSALVAMLLRRRGRISLPPAPSPSPR